MSLPTDNTFTLVILAMLKQRTPSSLKVFLISLAIFDDIWAILIIVIFILMNFILQLFIACEARYFIL
ncbi:hypothetical protein FPD38_00165 [Campylobacter volucris]|uniref:G-protein coupled receptors family 1 profile domain-containing protein n=1 Tax=Campylobacter volucris TaxID=1031542 RepID=A0A5C7E7U0_9BACT|nr:Na+/H+ antiporter NhaA [Campylobacter volucris]TXE90084.1 hypothetical protein FPD38_00165 [Campylobacter volucris]